MNGQMNGCRWCLSRGRLSCGCLSCGRPPRGPVSRVCPSEQGPVEAGASPLQPLAAWPLSSTHPSFLWVPASSPGHRGARGPREFQCTLHEA